jgi:hypothetical protein
MTSTTVTSTATMPKTMTRTGVGNEKGWAWAWERIPGMAELWPRYLANHRDRRNRAMHHIGGWIVIAGVAASLGAGAWLAFASVILAYGCAFAGHYLFEGNTPLTLERPLLAAIAEARMFLETAGGLSSLSTVQAAGPLKTEPGGR